MTAARFGLCAAGLAALALVACSGGDPGSAQGFESGGGGGGAAVGRIALKAKSSAIPTSGVTLSPTLSKQGGPCTLGTVKLD